MSDSRFIVRTVAFLFLLLLFFAAGMNIQRVTLAFGRSQAENYEALAREALRSRDYSTAQRYVERRLAKKFYDFNALYLLGEIYATKGEYDQAAEAIRQIFVRFPGARANQVEAVGFDEAKSYYLFALYSWNAKRYSVAAELLRAALDAGYPIPREDFAQYLLESALETNQAEAVARVALKVRDAKAFLHAVEVLLAEKKTKARGELLLAEWMETVDRNPFAAELRLRGALSLLPKDPALSLALANIYERVFGGQGSGDYFRRLSYETTGVKALGPGLFRIAAGHHAEKRGLVMGHNGKATATISTGAFRVTRLILNASGSWALGMYPVLIVRVDGQDVAWLYLDGLQPRIHDMELWPSGAPKDLTLEFEFINDAYEPTSKADRNVVLHDILLY